MGVSWMVIDATRGEAVLDVLLVAVWALLAIIGAGD